MGRYQFRLYGLWIISIACMLFTFGCTTQETHRIVVHKPSPTPLKKYKIIALEILPKRDASLVPTPIERTFSDISESLEAAIIAKIVEKNLFETIYSTVGNFEKDFDIKLVANVTYLRDVGEYARFFGRELAGAAALQTDVKLYERNSGALLADATIVGKTIAGISIKAAEVVAEQSHPA